MTAIISLREEIENIILNDRIFFSNDNNRWIKESEIVDKIIRRIEKRIDEQYLDLSRKNKDHIINLDTACGWNLALDTVKEFLK